MKEKCKKIFKIIFGTEKNIAFILNLSTLLTGIIFLMFASIFHAVPDSASTFMYISATFLAIWVCITQVEDSLFKFIVELVRLLGFLTAFIFFTYDCLLFCSDYKKTEIPHIIICSIGLFSCSIYFFAKLNAIYDFIKNIFFKIKAKLFNSVQPAATKTKALFENMTTLIVSITAFIVAIKGIIEGISWIAELFKH